MVGRSVSFVVKGVPPTRSRPRFARIRRKDGTQTMVAYQPKGVGDIAIQAVVQELASRDGFKPLEGPLSLEILAYFPAPKALTGRKRKLLPFPKGTRPDLDNCIKALLDNLVGIVFRDDAQIAHLVARKMIAEEPRLEVVVREERE